MRLIALATRLRLPLLLLVAFLVVLGAVDAGSVVLTRLSVPDDVVVTGHSAAAEVEGMPATQHSAVIAYDAARAAAADHALRVSAEDFRVFPDGRVRLTATRTAPTLLLHRLPRVREYVEVSATKTVDALPYGSTAR